MLAPLSFVVRRERDPWMRPETRYAKSGDIHIAYQVVGEGPIDLVLVHGWISHVEYQWEEPSQARFLERLASFSRLITFDKRGTGLSDRIAENALPTLEERMDDVYGTYARWVRDAEYPWAPTLEYHQAAFARWDKEWGTPIGLEAFAPSVATDERWRQWWARHLRLGASPSAGVALYRMNTEIDVRNVLPTIRVPTLILHRSGDRLIEAAGARYVAGRIPGARYVEQPGTDHIPWLGDSDALLAEIQEFLTGVRPTSEADRILATVMFVDSSAPRNEPQRSAMHDGGTC
jgi:pimeloyl-ACP methyl ester carboxylesterase